jgi:glyoxylase-like metal-dependent hydrolase (beta-lactamase superfamily II)
LTNTEPHGDHFSGNFYFEGTGIAHQGTREAVLAASVDDYRERLKQMAPDSLSLLEGFWFRPPTITFTERLTLHLGKHSFQLIHFPGHSPYQIAVFIPEERVVFTSDNVFGGVQAWLHQALPQEWLQSLERMKELDADIFVPGHGSIGDQSCLTDMQGFIQAWIDAVKAAIDQGMSLEEAQEKVSLLDLRPMETGSESRAQMVQQMNVARLYQVLKGE